MKIGLTLGNRDGGDCGSVSLSLEPQDPKFFRSRGGAYGHLGGQNTSRQQNIIILGSPFFFGRTISFVIDGQDSPLGRGPLISFQDASVK
jgi:hypothetical protein